ncbi:MAG: hypothetical protein EA427_13960 [Spirochaetaceae bacterium]|nr:MAG: hypothetical protein EA427_13960 [Spirochaetaceae bacterium]
MRELIEVLRRSERIVVFSGAGISTDSGIPDYRGSGGQYSAYQPVYYQEFLSSSRKRREYWQHKASVWPAMRAADPTAGHRLVVRLHERGCLSGVITQNVDGLHEKSGIPREMIVNLHGTNLEVECIGCGRRIPAGDVLDGLADVLNDCPLEAGGMDANRALRMPAEEEVPLCRSCGNFLKPATVMFGQNLRSSDLERAETMLRDCDLLLAVGSTLMVQPAASIPVLAKRNGAFLVILTLGGTPLDGEADLRIDDAITPVAEAVLNVL